MGTSGIIDGSTPHGSDELAKPGSVLIASPDPSSDTGDVTASGVVKVGDPTPSADADDGLGRESET